MSLILDGTNGLSDVDGSAATPAIRGTDANTGIFFPAADTIGFAEGGAEVMRIDSSGNVGIGTSSPEANAKLTVKGLGIAVSKDSSTVTPSGFDFKCRSANPKIGLHVIDTGQVATLEFGTASDNSSGAYINVTGTDPLRFGTSNTERARIDSSGNLLVGTTSVLGTSAAGTTHITGGANDGNETPFYLRNTYSTAGRYWKVGPTNNAGFIVYNNSNTGQYMTYGATSWTATSDERLKTNLIPIQNAVQKVSSLRAVTGRYKTDDEGISRSFLIAQDVQAVLPEAVDVQDDEIQTLGLRYTETIPLLVAAIKEQQAIIEQLKARLDAANL